MQGATIAEDEEDDTLLAKHRLARSVSRSGGGGAGNGTDANNESPDAATIKKLHVSSANLQRVSRMTHFCVYCLYVIARAIDI